MIISLFDCQVVYFCAAMCHTRSKITGRNLFKSVWDKSCALVNMFSGESSWYYPALWHLHLHHEGPSASSPYRCLILVLGVIGVDVVSVTMWLILNNGRLVASNCKVWLWWKEILAYGQNRGGTGAEQSKPKGGPRPTSSETLPQKRLLLLESRTWVEPWAEPE